jgi:hypothetical protein
MRRAKTVMVCCARVMLGKVFVVDSVLFRESVKVSLRNVVESFESS